MDLPSQTQLTLLRELLTNRLAELRVEVRAAQLARQETGAAAREVTDRKDEAAQHQTEEVDSAQDERDRDELAQVEAALKRLDAGSYGRCADCGEPIALQRLRVQPAARRCAACQLAHEESQARSH